MKLKVSSLLKRFGDSIAVANLSFVLETGSVTAFIGPNGAGKTTTMRILAGLETFDAGTIKADKVSLSAHPEMISKLIGFVPDSLPAHFDINVYEYLDFYARAYQTPADKRDQLVKDLMDFTNLTGIREKMLINLSKGMKQRVSIARALVNDPQFILMDEPAAGLDPRARIELRELIKVLSGQGKGILISSHILSELSEICDSVLIIERGRLLKNGNLETITESVESKSARRIIIKILGDVSEFVKYALLQPEIVKPTVNGNQVEFEFPGTDDDASELLKRIVNDGHKVIDFHFKQQNLESVFMSITKGGVQ